VKLYDTTAPRYNIHPKNPQTPYEGGTETLSQAEAKFWVELGYTVTEFRWNGTMFVFAGLVR
jgi:hypothetical protein